MRGAEPRRALLILGSPDGSLLAVSEGPVPDRLPRTYLVELFAIADAPAPPRQLDAAEEASARF